MDSRTSVYPRKDDCDEGVGFWLDPPTKRLSKCAHSEDRLAARNVPANLQHPPNALTKARDGMDSKGTVEQSVSRMLHVVFLVLGYTRRLGSVAQCQTTMPP